MPEVFAKNCKIKLVEYGGAYDPDQSWKVFRTNFVKAVKTLFKA